MNLCLFHFFECAKIGPNDKWGMQGLQNAPLSNGVILYHMSGAESCNTLFYRALSFVLCCHYSTMPKAKKPLRKKPLRKKTRVTKMLPVKKSVKTYVV